jgi:tRNA 2-thiouridine synthesizing protein A
MACPRFDRGQYVRAHSADNGNVRAPGEREFSRPHELGSPVRTQFDQGGLAVNFDKELDARGLSCPLPILKTKKSLNDLTSGQVLKVVATDPGSVKDMQAFANQTGNPLLSSTEENKTFVFYLKKK